MVMPYDPCVTDSVHQAQEPMTKVNAAALEKKIHRQKIRIVQLISITNNLIAL